MARTPRRPGQPSGVPSVGTRLSDLARIDDLSPTDRDRFDRIISEADRIDGLDVRDVLIVAEPRPGRDAFQALTPKSVTDALKKFTTPQSLPKTGKLHHVTGRVLDHLRDTDPRALPKLPIDLGKLGPAIPVASKTLTELVKLAAKDNNAGGDSVVWDDGINQLIVHISTMTTTVTEGRVRVEIRVEADGLKTTMKVLFGVGTEKKLAGMVMATPDRPAGDPLIARIWGDALIALAHSSLVDASKSMAGAAGRDVTNARLIPGSLTAKRGTLTIGSLGRPKVTRLR